MTMSFEQAPHPSSCCDGGAHVTIHCGAAVMRDEFVLNSDVMQAIECKLLTMVDGLCVVDGDGWM